MSGRTRILFLSQMFEPEPVYKGVSFVKALEERGFKVDVVTGFPNYPSGKLYAGYRVRPLLRQVIEGIRVTRLPLYPSHDSNALKRSLNYLSFFVSATAYLMFRTRRYDAIYIYHPPITVGLAAAVAGLFRRAPFILEVQDLWPDAVSASGMASRWAERPLGAVCRFVYRRARRIVAQSRGMRSVLIERGTAPEKIRAVYNWAEEKETVPPGETDLARFGFEERFTFLYGGNIGPHQALGTAVEAAFKAAQRAPHIRLLLVGSGLDMEDLRAVAAEQGQDIVRVLEGVPRERVADVFAAADVLLLHLADAPLYAVTVPSKTQFYLAMGKPVLAALTGEAARIVEAAGAGTVVPPADSDALARAMVEMAQANRTTLAKMGSRGLQYYRANMSFDSGMAQIVSIINEATRAS